MNEWQFDKIITTDRGGVQIVLVCADYFILAVVAIIST
jgi:hypothetical protein